MYILYMYIKIYIIYMYKIINMIKHLENILCFVSHHADLDKIISY